MVTRNGRQAAGNKLVEWLRSQYGPNKRYKSARSLSLAAGRNPNTVIVIEERGHATAAVLIDLAEATGVRVLDLFILTGWVASDETEPNLSPDELALLSVYRQAPEQERSRLRRIMEAAVPYETEVVEERRADIT